MPAVLKVMMRHADISTTMKFYVNQSTADLRQAMWAAAGPKSAAGVPVPAPEPADACQGQD